MHVNDLANLIDFVGFLKLILLTGLMKIIGSIIFPKKARHVCEETLMAITRINIRICRKTPKHGERQPTICIKRLRRNIAGFD